MTEVNREPKYSIEITIETRYLAEQSDTESHRYAFAYTVRILNKGSVAAQLISRHWLIEDMNGKLVEVRGLGVVGRQPLLQPGEHFDYTSGSELATSVGTMRGSYFFVAEDGHRFDAEIAPFTLAIPRTLH
ncbi:MAG: Co2+/Mg2+ efflux protein ApaG [Burkholderiaceae bacterium]